MARSEQDIRQYLLRNIILQIPTALTEAEQRGIVGIISRPKDPRAQLWDHFGLNAIREERDFELRPDIRSIAKDLGIDVTKPFWLFETVVRLAVESPKISGEKRRKRGRPAISGAEERHQVSTYVLSANRLRAVLQVVRNKTRVSNAELAREIVARKRDENRIGFLSLEDPPMNPEEYHTEEQNLSERHKRFLELFKRRVDLPAPRLHRKSLLDPDIPADTYAYSWTPSETEVNEVPGWLEEFKKVKSVWIPIPE